MFQQALRGSEDALGADHMPTLGTLSKLGNLYHALGKLEEAEKMFKPALHGEMGVASFSINNFKRGLEVVGMHTRVKLPAGTVPRTPTNMSRITVPVILTANSSSLTISKVSR